jgi:hypothetical protein
MLSAVSDYPTAVVGRDHAYVAVSGGWAEVYSPGVPAEWWIGRDHRDAFRLDEHASWRAAYVAACGGTPTLRVELLALPGIPIPSPHTWLLNPIAGGGVFVVVLPVHDVTEAAAAAVRRSLGRV